jgi:hypothetical protein
MSRDRSRMMAIAFAATIGLSLVAGNAPAEELIGKVKSVDVEAKKVVVTETATAKVRPGEAEGRLGGRSHSGRHSCIQGRDQAWQEEKGKGRLTGSQNRLRIVAADSTRPRKWDGTLALA